MRKVGIIGMGHVGVTVGYTLLTKGLIDKLVCIDTNSKKENAEFYDFMDSLASLPHNTQIFQNDYNQLIDVDIIVTAFGDITLSVEGNNRFGELDLNAKNAKEVGQKLKDIGYKGIILNISNPCDVICALLQYYSGLPKEKVIGTGTSLDTARMKRALSMEFKIDSSNIKGFVLGEHGDSQFTAWSTVYVNEQPIIDSDLDFNKLNQNTKNGAWIIVDGKGYTSYGIATCATEIIQAIFNDSNKLVIISCYSEKYKTYIGYPALVNKNGFSKIINLSLTKEEENQLQNSAQMIANKISQYIK